MKTKTFDAVKLMRELRDKLSQELEPMTPEERLHHIRKKAAASSLARRFPEGEGKPSNSETQTKWTTSSGDGNSDFSN